MQPLCFPARLLALVSASALFAVTSAAVEIRVDVDRPGAAIQPTMWGVFYEDINFGADGGLYAELVKNRSFEFPESLAGWHVPAADASGTRVIVQRDPQRHAANAHFARVVSADGRAVLENEGFRGIGVKEGEVYDFSVDVRGGAGLLVSAELVAPSGLVLASAEVSSGASTTWAKREVSLTPSHTEARARLRLVFSGRGEIDVDFVSLFPRNTWKNRKGGLRADMVQALADMKPGFFRFPGGCIVEGSRLELRYQWKKTIGPVEERELLINRWNAEFKHRAAPDYYQSFGVGFFEYFLLCADIGAAPLPIINCGMACQFNSGELVPLDQLDPFIQDALDLIEFANGPVTSEWGAKRAAMGHPEPFNLRHLGIGNEQWGPEYVERYARFAAVLREKHPEIQLVGAAGPSPEDERFHYLWKELPAHKVDIIDEHSYASPEWFFDQAKRYDYYDRNGPKVCMGEYAAHDRDIPFPPARNHWRAALAEAAFMTGMERNADVVHMAAYAPLFSHADAWQWAPDLIWVDNLSLVKTPSYHVQSLFALNRGDRVVPLQLGALSESEEKRFYGSAVLDEQKSEVVLKLVNATGAASSAQVRLGGARVKGAGTLTRLGADSPTAINTFNSSDRVQPVTSPFEAKGDAFELTIPADSVLVLRLPVETQTR